MKWMTLILLVMCLTAFADDTSHKKSRPKPPPNAKTVKTLTLPPGAKPAGANTWNYTDPQGKKWIYRKTPFGLSRIDAEAEAAAAEAERPSKAPEITSATVAGDVAKFERSGPFGTYRWEKKLSELNAEEKSAVEKTQAAKAAK